MPTVVIADDSPTLRRIVSSVLKGEGYDVVAVEDGMQAVRTVFRTQPDAVILDVQMPRVSGYVAARLLKGDWQTADIPIVLLTTLDAASERYWGAQTGAERYLTKDFEAPELARAVREVVEASAVARQGAPVLRPDPVELAEDDVMAKICDLLDRKLFETSVASQVVELAATRHGFEATVSGLFDLLGRFVDYELAAVLLAHERSAYVSVLRPVTHDHYAEFLRGAADAVVTTARGEDLGAFSAESLDARVADPRGLLGVDPDELPGGPVGSGMSTFLSMPLRGHGGQVLGVLALSSAVKSAFGETALSTLKLIEGPAAVVIDNARLSGVPA